MGTSRSRAARSPQDAGPTFEVESLRRDSRTGGTGLGLMARCPSCSEELARPPTDGRHSTECGRCTHQLKQFLTPIRPRCVPCRIGNGALRSCPLANARLGQHQRAPEDVAPCRRRTVRTPPANIGVASKDAAGPATALRSSHCPQWSSSWVADDQRNRTSTTASPASPCPALDPTQHNLFPFNPDRSPGHVKHVHKRIPAQLDDRDRMLGGLRGPPQS